MLTTKLYGGAGNQMFQIANCLAHSWRSSVEYRIPRQTMDPDKWPVYFTHFPDLLPYTFDQFGLYREKGHGYHAIDKRDQLCFDGYFQSYKYFHEYRDKIIGSFLPAFERFGKFEIPGFVSLHIRRGDYLEHPDKHPFIAKSYIRKAIQYFNDLGFTHFFVFSDDVEWAQENIHENNFGIINYFMHSKEGADPLHDMYLMSTCQHNIVCNSTFSWWGAYLNQNPKKVVVCPHEDNWFGPELKHLDVSDLLLPEWIRIKS